MNRKGFSMIEIMVAAGIIAVVVIGGYFLFSNNTGSPTNIDEPPQVTNQVPAPGFTDVDEMVVEDTPSAQENVSDDKLELELTVPNESPIISNLLPPSQSHEVTYLINSGVHENSTNEEIVAFSELVQVPEASSLRLHVSEHNLGRASYILFVSLEDDEEQQLNATTLLEWNNSTAFFNGDKVRVELHVAPGDKGIFFKIEKITAGN